jgi:hypothetical protein
VGAARLAEPGEPVAERKLAPEILRLRHLGARGGLIRPHRALATLDTTLIGAAAGIAAGVALAMGVVLFLQTIASVWTGIFLLWHRALALPGQVVTTHEGWDPYLTFDVPSITLSSAEPSLLMLTGTTVAVVLVLLLSIPLARRSLPLAYLLRTLAGVQATAIAYFGLLDRPLPYDLEGYTRTLLLAGMGVMILAPLLLGLTYNVYNVGVHRKLMLVLLVEAHFLFLLPHQYLLHAVIVHYASLLFLPLLYFAFGVLLDIVVLMGWYAWALSWPDLPPLAPRRARRPLLPPRRRSAA